ncbi:MAG: PAS domain S-box protein [Spirochaetales bacterium]|nr:PAS domain S-box protein [Spirochaetales bacterium]
MKKLIRIFIYLFLAVSFCAAQVDNSDDKNILILNSYNLGLNWTQNMNSAIVDFFGFQPNVSFQIEFMDSKISTLDNLYENYYNYLKVKYSNTKFDCIISTDDDAYQFLLQYGDDCFGHVPVVFCGVNNYEDAQLVGHDNFTGIVEISDVRATIDLALALHPETENIIYINDKTLSGQHYLNEVMTYIGEYEPRYKVQIISDWTMDEMTKYLREETAKSVVILSVYNLDGAGQSFKHSQTIRYVQKACNFPIYSAWDFFLGYGVIGGKMTFGHIHATYAATLADKILHGKPISELPVIKKNLNRYVFDYNQVVRYNVSLYRAGVAYRLYNSPFKVFSVYRTFLFMVIILILFMIILLMAVNSLKRRSVEMQLSESKNEHESLVASMNEGLFVQSADEYIRYVNDKFAQMLNYSRNEILGYPLSRFIDPSQRLTFLSDMESRILTDKDIKAEVNFCRSDGSKLTAIISPKPMFENNGKYKGNFCVVTDITQLKNTEKQLMYEKERLLVTLNSIVDGVIATKLNGDIIFVNKVAAELMEWNNDELNNHNVSDVYVRFDKRNNTLINTIEVSEHNKDNVHDYFLRTKSGKLIDIQETVAAISDDDHTIGYVVVFRDVRNDIILQEEIIKNQKIESIGLLAGGLAHDFNNILSGIMGNLYLAKTYLSCEDFNIDEMWEIISDMEHASERAKHLTTQMLTFSKGGTPVRKNINLKNLIYKSVNFSIVGKNVRCEFDIEDNLRSADADEGQIDQVLNNLVINASQAMPDGGIIHVSAHNVTVDDNSELPLNAGNYIRVSVADEGVGISPDNLKKIFDPYFTTKTKGYGLGLASTYSIIKKHYGYITVDSEEGKGTTFTFYLMASREVSPDVDSHDMLSRSEDVERNKHINILIMDDNEAICQTNTKLLNHFGFNVQCAADGDEAISLYTQMMDSGKPFDICILDLVIPGKKNGDKVLADLLALDPHVKAILSSGYSVDPVVADYKTYGFLAALPKPYMIEELIDLIHDLVK